MITGIVTTCLCQLGIAIHRLPRIKRDKNVNQFVDSSLFISLCLGSLHLSQYLKR